MGYTKYEKARIIGSRALQISMGAPLMLKLSHKDLERLRYSPIEIAKLEFKEGVVPITVKRPYPETINKNIEAVKSEKSKTDDENV